MQYKEVKYQKQFTFSRSLHLIFVYIPLQEYCVLESRGFNKNKINGWFGLSVVMTEYPKELSELPDDYALTSDKIEITRAVIDGQS